MGYTFVSYPNHIVHSMPKHITDLSLCTGVGYYNQHWMPWNSHYSPETKNNSKDVKLEETFGFFDGMEVDMLFDVDQRILRICVVGKCEPQREAKIWKFSLRIK